MSIIEFKTTIKDGVIEIPQKYQGKIKDRVRVILLPEEKKSARRNLIDRLLEHPVRSRNFVPLSRDDIGRQFDHC